MCTYSLNAMGTYSPLSPYHSSSIIFMTNSTFSGWIMHHENTRLFQNKVGTYHDGFCTKQQHFTLSSALSHHFFKLCGYKVVVY